MHNELRSQKTGRGLAFAGLAFLLCIVGCGSGTPDATKGTTKGASVSPEEDRVAHRKDVIAQNAARAKAARDAAMNDPNGAQVPGGIPGTPPPDDAPRDR